VFLLALLPCPAGRSQAAAPPEVDLQDLLAELKATLRWEPDTETGTLVLDRGKVVFQAGSPWILLDYRELLYTGAAYRREGTLVFPAETASSIREYVRREGRERPRVSVILIDPGHGGKDTGALGTVTANGKTKTIQEKDVVLQVGLKLHELLARRYPDKRMLLTRSDDTYIRLEERTELANGIALAPGEAVIFLSIHANASLNRKARGFEVWYLPTDFRRDLIDPKSLEADTREIAPILNVLLEEEFSIESITLARAILAGFEREVGATSENRGIKEESWFVVRNARMPSVLVELGFVTHPEEAALLDQEQYLQKLVDAIYTGVCAFITAFESSRGFTE
jgi:N-acetylmuramoyl-L-alanine amidase